MLKREFIREPLPSRERVPFGEERECISLRGDKELY